MPIFALDALLLIFSLFLVQNTSLANPPTKNKTSYKILEPNSPEAALLENEKHLSFGCTISDISGQLLRSFSYMNCLFLSSGDMIAASSLYGLGGANELIYLTKEMRPKWKLPNIWPTHQLTPSDDENDILVIASDYEKSEVILIRWDTLWIVGMDGSVKKRFSFLEYSKMGENKKIFDEPGSNPWTTDGNQNISIEATHLNSFYEIPKNSQLKKNPKLKNATYIAHSNKPQMTWFFDENLNELLHLKSKKMEQAHDVQIQQNGLQLQYTNSNSSLPKQSQIQILDPITQKVTWSYRGKPQPFFSEFCGGIQQLPNDRLMISDNRAGAYVEIISRKGKSLKKIKLPATEMQQAKLGDLTEFLKNNRGQ